MPYMSKGMLVISVFSVSSVYSVVLLRVFVSEYFPFVLSVPFVANPQISDEDGLR